MIFTRATNRIYLKAISHLTLMVRDFSVFLVLIGLPSKMVLASAQMEGGNFFALPKMEGAPAIIFGDMRGHFEPCGCNKETDMGGVQRISGFVDLERSRAPLLDVISLGNNLHVDQFKVADEFILKAISQIKPSAKLVGKSEWVHRKKLPQKDYLLTNAPRDTSFKKFVKTPYRLIFGIGGYEGLNVTDEHRAFMKKKIDEHKKESRDNIVTLLYVAGEKRNTKLLGELLGVLSFDEVYMSNISSFDTYPDQRERLDESLLSFEVAYGPNLSKKRLVPMSPIGGQGVFVKGLAKVDIFSKDSSKECKASDYEISGVADQIVCAEVKGPEAVFSGKDSDAYYRWLARGELYGKSLQGLITRYRAASENEFSFYMDKKRNFLKENGKQRYAGSESCAGCHADAYKTFKESAHFHALETLEKQTQDKNMACVGCHVVGFKELDGFISSSETPALKGVGCEVCHGPRADHVAVVSSGQKWDKTMSSPKYQPKAVCSECHHPPHSVSFDFKSYWEKIKHP